MKNTALNSAAENRKLDAVPAENARLANIRGGSIGSATRRSTSTKATSAASPPTSVATVSRLPQPTSLPRIRAHTIPSAAAVTSTSPGVSVRARGP